MLSSHGIPVTDEQAELCKAPKIQLADDIPFGEQVKMVGNGMNVHCVGAILLAAALCVQPQKGLSHWKVRELLYGKTIKALFDQYTLFSPKGLYFEIFCFSSATLFGWLRSVISMDRSPCCHDMKTDKLKSKPVFFLVHKVTNDRFLDPVQF